MAWQQPVARKQRRTGCNIIAKPNALKMRNGIEKEREKGTAKPVRTIGLTRSVEVAMADRAHIAAWRIVHSDLSPSFSLSWVLKPATSFIEFIKISDKLF